MRAVRASAVVLVASLGTATLAAPVRAQDVTYQETSNVKLGGGLGALASFAAKLGGGSMKNIVTTTYISGHRMRVDTRDESTIYDADAGTITTLNRKDKTYFQRTFAEMAQAMETARAQMEAGAQRKDEKGQDSMKMSVDFHVSVDRPGERRKVAGYKAERAFLTLEAVGTDTRQSDQQTEQVGTMVFFNDVWMTQDTPLEKARRGFQEALVKNHGSEIQAQARGLAAIFTQNPEMSQGMKQSARQLQKISGVPVRTTSYVVLVSPDHEFDRKLVLGGQESAKPKKKKSGGLFGKLAKAAAKAELGQSTDEQKKDDQKNAAPQATMAVITTEVTSVEVGAIPESTFRIPDGYTSIPAPTIVN